MRKVVVYIIWLWFFCLLESYGQENLVQMDFIITLNGELEPGTISNLRLIVKSLNQKVEEVEIHYHPGNLALDKSDYSRVFSNSNDTVFIAFDHNYFCGEKHQLVNYEIPFYQSWFDNSYMILRVYDLSKGKYKNVFEPLSKEKNYTYELDHASGSIRRVRINKIKKKKKCR